MALLGASTPVDRMLSDYSRDSANLGLFVLSFRPLRPASSGEDPSLDARLLP